MKKRAAIDSFKLEMLRLLLKDPKIASCVTLDGENAGEIIVLENGDVKLGRSKKGWINKLFDNYNKIDFFTLANRIAVVITGKDTVSGTTEELREMVMEIVEQTMVKNDVESTIEMLFLYCMLCCPSSPLRSSYIKLGEIQPKTKRIKNVIKNVRGTGTAYVDLGSGGCMPFELVIDTE